MGDRHLYVERKRAGRMEGVVLVLMYAETKKIEYFGHRNILKKTRSAEGGCR
jgi:hypothetical protein